MVCLSNEVSIQALVNDATKIGDIKQSSIFLSPSKPVNSVFTEVATEFHYQVDAIRLFLETRENSIDLNQHKGRVLSETGLSFDPNDCSNILIVIMNQKNTNPIVAATDTPNSEDDLLLGASASPTTGDVAVKMRLEQLDFNYDVMEDGENDVPVLDAPNNYVGLVNQAMTCYLNSLLQALYMTPEFRNALYNWEFDGVNETRSIPFQLQKLFLNLQTSHKIAVETTDLTKSFGWQGSEAWQQHDIQELCRVMFDALEQKFKDTKQANLINDLYEGKMLDYVRCLECGTEKSREDTFLDIPLPVRPFGSTVSYNSVEEALRAFVQPETLDGSNQYHCEKCNKKCDAHKGLKFTKFPYLLTLHLKRFDFDYNTMHRIKLNDKVTFPENLNLNAFISNQNQDGDSPADDRDITVKCDDCSTTDSGSALDDENCQIVEGPSTVNGQDLNCQEEDEGIDMTITSNQQENIKNANQGPKGPYIYELFSIMIHSGGASGGHYYAYIKDFQTRSWYCFNDQNVSRITEEDIKKTYGGGSLRGHYSSAYSPSTNGYMLMYRQIDKERNATAMTVDNFPPHIRKLFKQMKAKEEQERLVKEKQEDLVKTKVYCYHPVQNQLVNITVLLFLEEKLEAVLKDILQHFKLEGLVALEDCRLVSYNKHQDTIICSFDNEWVRVCDVVATFNVCNTDFMLEIKQPGSAWKEYKPGGVNMKVYTVNLETEEVDGPVTVHVNAGETVGEFKETLAKMFNMDANTMKMVQETYSNEPKHLDEDEMPMKFDPNCTGYKIYISNALDEDPDKSFVLSKLHKIIDRFVHVVSLTVVLPDTDSLTLESMSIPPLDHNQNLETNKSDTIAPPPPPPISSPSSTAITDRSNSPRVSPQPVVEAFGDQSNSEDSSLSDSDRTLVGDAPGDCLALLSSSSDSPADQHMASPSDPTEDTYNPDVLGNPGEEMSWDDTEVSEPMQRCSTNYYFRVVQPLKSNQNIVTETDGTRSCKVMIDKRMNIGRFKKCLETIVGVPVEYFKIYRQYPNQDEEWWRLNDTLSSTKDGERLIIKLGRVLRKDEFVGKIYHLTPDNENGEPFTFLFEHVIAKGQTVGQVKREIIQQAKKQHMLDISYTKSRLRRKTWKNPSKVYLDDQKFMDDITVTNSMDIFIQQLPDVEKVTSTNQLVLFVKQWCPSTLTLKPFQEVVLDAPTMDDLKKKISEISAIEEQNIEIACPKSTFPCDMHVLSIQNELDWNTNVTDLENWPWQIYDDGSVLFYRNALETPKHLSAEERKEINQRESNRLGLFTVKNYPLSGREKALKIYLDNSPSKSEDSD